MIVISISESMNGVEEFLVYFEGVKYLVFEQEKDADYGVICWESELYKKEKSFISFATSLGTMSLNLEIGSSEIRKINDKIKELLVKSVDKVDKLQVVFKDTSSFQIMSDYEPKFSNSVFESNLVEAGLRSSNS